MKKISKSWKSSTSPRKPRKFIANAPLHIKSKFVSSHLSTDLRKKHKLRSIRVIKGDKVKVMRGMFKGKTGNVERIDIKQSKAFITGIENIKKDGSKTLYPIHSSNLLIQELNTKDKKRIEVKK